MNKRSAGCRWLWSALAVLFLSAPGLRAQVRTYPIYEIRPIATVGFYSDATQQRLLHLSTEFSVAPDWRSTYALLYRRTTLDYKDGFGYRQNQISGSVTRLFSSGDQYFSFRADLSVATSNSAETDGSVTAFCEGGWIATGGAWGMSGGGFYGSYPDGKTWGGTGGLWTVFLNRHVFSMRVNSQSFSGPYHDGKTFFSGSLHSDFRVNSKGGVLVSGRFGRRSLFYDPDIKLMYTTKDIFRGGAGVMVYGDLSEVVRLFVDATAESYNALEGGSYSVAYVTLGLRLRF